MIALRRCLAVLLLLVPFVASDAHAQPDATDAETTSAFSLSTSEVFTTRDAPHFFLTFRRVTELAVRF